MMSIGLHCRLAGRPGRAAALARFIDHIRGHDRVWIARRIDIASHWKSVHPHRPPALRPSAMARDAFVARFGGVFERSPWIAERAFELELGPAHDSAAGLHNALARVFRAAGESERLGVLKAHPDLAGRLAAARRLTPESAAEQASAGLDLLDDRERAAFTRLNAAYVEKFGFPFIIAVRGLARAEILAAFEARLANDRATEFATACRQVERIALLRLKDMLPD
jgi:OHCU decarboxylase